MTTSRSIAVYRSGALGDLIVVFPVLQVLRRTWPQARIAFVAPPEVGRLTVASGWADRLLSADASWVGGWFAADPAALRVALGPTEALLAFTRDDDGALRRTAEAAGIARVVTWPPFPAADEAAHASDHALRALEAWGIRAQGIAPEVRATDEMRAAGRVVAIAAGLAPDEPYAVVHSGSSSPKTDWPGMPELARRIEEQLGLPVLVNRGPAEVERGPAGAWPGGTRVVGPLPLDALAGLIAGARAYAGNDTGPSHLAAALGVPCVAVFGPASDALRWAPRGPRTAVAACAGGWPMPEVVMERLDHLAAG